MRENDTDAGPFSSQMLLLYSNTFLVMLQFTIVQPTAGRYLDFLGVSPTLGGTAIAASQFGSAIFQIPIYFMLRCMPFKIVIVALLACELLGSILYAVALPAQQVAILFVGRAISSFCSGQQIYMTGLTECDLSDEDKKVATQANSLVYQISGFLSLSLAAFVLSASPLAATPTTNAANIPGYVSAALILVLCLFALVRVPTRRAYRFRVRRGPLQLARACVGLYIVLVTTIDEGLRQVTIFELYFARWQHDWPSSGPETVAYLAALIFLLSALAYLYDRRLKYTKTNMTVSMLCLALTLLPLAPWRCATTASVLLQGVFGVIYAIFVRIMYGFGTLLVIQAAQRSRRVRLYYLSAAFVTSLGLGVGATVSSAVDLSVVPFLVACGLNLVAVPLTYLVA